MWVKVLHTARVGRIALAWDARTEVRAAMESVTDTRRGTGNGRQRRWKDSERQACCMKRISGRVRQ